MRLSAYVIPNTNFFHIENSFTDFDSFHSSAVWASLGTPSFRPTLPVTRTRNWLPTSSLTSLMMTRSNWGLPVLIFLLFLLRFDEYQSCCRLFPHLAETSSTTLQFLFPSPFMSFSR